MLHTSLHTVLLNRNVSKSYTQTYNKETLYKYVYIGI